VLKGECAPVWSNSRSPSKVMMAYRGESFTHESSRCEHEPVAKELLFRIKH